MAQDKEKVGTTILNNAGGILGAAGMIGGWLGIGEKRQDKRQIEQDKALGEQALDRNKRAADYEAELAMKMWKDTNYGARLAEAEKAGVSKAAVLGGSGTGTQGISVGAPAGGQAANAAATSASKTASIQAAMQLGSQLALQKAQKENIEADTANKLAKTGETTVRTETAKGTQKAEIDRAATEAQTAIEEMWLRTNERTVSDHTIKQRVEMTMQELVGQIAKNKNTDADTKKKQAETIIAEFDAKMTEEGISTRAPWYLKMVTDVLEKAGLNPLDTLKKK